MNQNPPTDEQLNQIEARANAATRGPWGAYTFGGDTLIEIAADLEETGTGYRARREICRLEDEPMDNDPTHREWTAEEDWAQVQADAEFIAHSPEDVRVLLAEVRRLRNELARRVQCNDCGAVGEIFTGDDGYAYLDPSGQVGHRSASAAGGQALTTFFAAHQDGGEMAEGLTGTRPCGHDDYHDPHEWADRPGIWCPGHSVTADAVSGGEQ